MDSFQQPSAAGSGRTAVAANLSPQNKDDRYATYAESRDPEESQNAIGSNGESTALVLHRPRTPVEIIPGLEGDDIIPGLSDKVVHARDIWSNVWSQMMLSRDEPPDLPLIQDSKETVSVSSVRRTMKANALIDDATTLASTTQPTDNILAKTPEKTTAEANDDSFCLFGCG